MIGVRNATNVIELYADKDWAKDVIQRARILLQELEEPENVIDGTPESGSPKPNES